MPHLPALAPEDVNLPGFQDLNLGLSTAPKSSLPEEWGASSAAQARQVQSCQGQLDFGGTQEVLSPSPPGCRQLPLLPDPPIWEEQPRSSSPSPRWLPARRQPRQGVSSAQMTLFPGRIRILVTSRS